MNTYASRLALSMTPYVAGEQPKGVKLIKLNTNENPYGPSPKALAAAKNASCETLRLYPDPEAAALKNAIASVNGVTAEQVFCGNGSDEVLAFAFAAFFSGKTLYIPDITYSFYPIYAKLFDARVETVPLKEDFTVDVEGLCKDGPVALANPNAPTGILLPLEQVRRIASALREKGHVLLVDEAYAAFSMQNALPLLEEFDNVLIIRTFSKSHSLAGMRIGYAIGHPELIRMLQRIRDSFNSYPVDRVAQAAAEASILDTEYTAETVQRIISSRDRCRAALEAAGIPVLPSCTNFLFVKADPVDAAPVQQALRDHGILVRHFKSPRLSPWLRVTIGKEDDMEVVTEMLLELCHI